MPKKKPVTVVCIYRVKKGKEPAFKKLLVRHWPTLRAAGLATAEPALVLRALDKKGQVSYLETFEWVDAAAAKKAHGDPEVAELWGPMEGLLSDMEFLDVEHVALAGA